MASAIMTEHQVDFKRDLTPNRNWIWGSVCACLCSWNLKERWQIIKNIHTGAFSFVISEHHNSGSFALFIILQPPQTSVKHLCGLGTHSIWFYGSRSFYATSTGMLNGMAVYLMNRFKTQVSPRAVPFPLFYCLFIPMRLCATITASFRLSMWTTPPKRQVWFPISGSTKIQCYRADRFVFDFCHLRQILKSKKQIYYTAKSGHIHQCLAPPRTRSKQQASEADQTRILMVHRVNMICTNMQHRFSSSSSKDVMSITTLINYP